MFRVVHSGRDASFSARFLRRVVGQAEQYVSHFHGQLAIGHDDTFASFHHHHERAIGYIHLREQVAVDNHCLLYTSPSPRDS